jgi:predicted ATP-dependent serine protease
VSALAATARVASRYRCVRCRRVQHVADVCGLCTCTLFVALPPTPSPASYVADAKKSLAEVDAVVGRIRESERSGTIRVAPPVALQKAIETDGLQVDPLPDRASTGRTEGRNPPRPSEPAPAPRVSRISLASVERERIERVPASWGGFDDVLGGGVPLSQVVVLGGNRGTGKSRLMLPVAAHVAAAARRPALYCSTEGQTAPELAAMLPEELDPHPIEICGSAKLSDLVAHVLELAPVLVVVDSVQELDVPGTRKGSDEHAYQCMMIFDELARTKRACVVCISQMSGMGRLRGSEKYQQLSDTIAKLERVNAAGELDDEGARIRFRIVSKNRGGPVDRRAFFSFDRDGALRPEEREQQHARG